MDLTRKHPFVGLICFVIPFLPFILGNQSYKPSEIFQQIEKTFKPSESIKHSLHPSQFNFWSRIKKEPLKVASGVPSSILIPLAKNSLIENSEGIIQFSIISVLFNRFW